MSLRAIALSIGLAAGIAVGASLSDQADATSWLDTPSYLMRVRWIRVNEVPQMEVRDGVCVLYMPDRADGALTYADQLLRACAATGKTRPDAPAGPGTVLLYWHERATVGDLMAAGEALYGRFVAWPTLGGFYWRPHALGPCHIFTLATALSAGHELKHCFDGDYHRNRLPRGILQ